MKREPASLAGLLPRQCQWGRRKDDVSTDAQREDPDDKLHRAIGHRQ